MQYDYILVSEGGYLPNKIPEKENHNEQHCTAFQFPGS